jgi:hypothetical protein
MFFSGNSKKNRIDYGGKRREEDLLAKLEVERKERSLKRVSTNMICSLLFSFFFFFLKKSWRRPMH